ncbi:MULTISPECIES: TnsA endonuclease N-terminal domain-containing protein [Alcaligenaceae]|uniref:TnsA endonuclease N terminal n=3 Tax=Alcaligenaceae TaxID=506 RepID=A0A1M5S804_9BURK|nr:TnsA endonuclease N-terminal domain-containing protein [Eoetvoesiella caeni]RBP38239.1 TnsA endonuclease-like protein [Eoetvoesiella caeni]SHH03358.1 TnsA endonuclease N terminal [Pollutimonas bauzanensis]SHH34626.1 TnsA endonuclease N terminal [Pollutimonas bauzanensis]
MEWDTDVSLYMPHFRNRLRRGQGLGVHAAYKPWLRVRDVPSRGTSSIVRGIRTSRSVHLLSKIETTYFFLLERRRTTQDCREQFPILEITRTLELCEELGVRHPHKGFYPEPFTIDFMVTELIDGKPYFRAASIKTPNDATNPSVLNRLAVEHRWCAEHNIPWTLVDTSAFDDTLLKNLRFMRAWFLHRHIPDYPQAIRFAACFLDIYRRNTLLDEIVHDVCQRLHLPINSGHDTFRFCAWSGLIPISLSHGLALNLPLVLRNVQNTH